MRTERGQKLSHYRLVEKIGEGGMGVVWKAEDTVLDRIVAIKVLPAEASHRKERRDMFFEEARLASSVSDAHIVQVYEFGREGDLDFIVMEFVEGKPLSKMLHGRPLPVEDVARLGLHVARALVRAHRKGLIHRDLKPANILATPDGEAKVVDFGLAALFDRSDSTLGSEELTQSALTEDGLKPSAARLVGTIPYMSPEQLRGEELDARSDIFSLGSVLYELATGQRAFHGVTNDEIAGQILKGHPVTPHQLVPRLPLELDRIIQKALARRKANRYQSMEDLAVDLKRLRRELESGSSPSYEDLGRSTATNRRRWWTLSVAAAVVLVAVIVASRWVPSRFGTPVDSRRMLVIPFEVYDDGGTSVFVGQVFAEQLAVALAQSKELIIPRVPRDLEASAAAAYAAKIGAGYLLTGRLARDRDRITASVTLVETQSDSIRWGMQLEGADADLEGLATSLARDLAAEVGVSLSAVYDDPIGTINFSPIATLPETTECLKAYWESDFATAVELAEDLGRRFPLEPATALLRGHVTYGAWSTTPVPDNASRFRRAIEQLRNLDPRHPFIEIWNADISANADPHKAAEALNRVLKRQDLSPAARAYVMRARASFLTTLGENEKALSQLEESLSLAPASDYVYRALARTLSRMGRAEEGLARARQAVALRPRSWSSNQYVGLSLSRLGRWEESIPWYEKACALAQSQEPCGNLAVALTTADRPSEAAAAAKTAERYSNTMLGSYNLACYYAVNGKKDQALLSLRHALDLGYSSEWITRDRDLDSLRGEPEFEAIVAEVRIRLAGN